MTQDIDVNALYSQVGGFGRYQKVLYVVIILSYILASWVTTFPVLVASKGDAQCTAEGSTQADKSTEFSCALLNVNDRYCSLPSKYWEFEAADVTRTLAVEWNLNCENDWKVGFISTMFFFGVWVGTSYFGYLCDSFGRRESFFLTTLLMGVFHFLSMFSTDYFSYLVLRTLAGIGNGGSEVSATLYLLESVGSEHRNHVSVGICASYAVGIMILAPLAAVLPHWRLLTLVTSIPFILVIPFYRYVVESPHYLAMKNQKDKLKLALITIARVNRMVGLEANNSLQALDSIQETTNSESTSQVNLAKVRRHPTLSRRFQILMVQWIFAGIGYYGLSFDVGNLGGNLYTNLFLSALVELPAFGPTSYLADTFGRKKTTIGFLVISCVSFIMSSVIPVPLSCENEAATCVQKSIRLVGSLIGKGTMAAIYSLLYVFSVELFPTSVRSRILSFLSQGSRVASMGAPILVLQLANVDRNLPFVVLGVFSIISTLLMIGLDDEEEISDKELIHGVDEATQLLPIKHP